MEAGLRLVQHHQARRARREQGRGEHKESQRALESSVAFNGRSSPGWRISISK